MLLRLALPLPPFLGLAAASGGVEWHLSSEDASRKLSNSSSLDSGPGAPILTVPDAQPSLVPHSHFSEQREGGPVTFCTTD